ncbi:hypothetical protein FE257_010684 [Aspergillus nanangensis]|uniref:Uncharacterized protein n=1 Tax=Aspergillus nanangensis TaxID=2582783 RepID=A0AAD4CIQ6_ASPNN|nr:hypothetical protein FE257_010684 [Aspergillus nanangensis]
MQSEPPHVFLLAQPRTASHLLVQILGLDAQPQVHWSCDKSGIFTKTRRVTSSLSRKSPAEWSDEEKHQMQSCFQQCFDILDEHRVAGEKQDKIVFAKEHCDQIWDPTAGHDPVQFPKVTVRGQPVLCQDPDNNQKKKHPNPTVFPTEYLAMWQAVFCIRHPALAFPSYCRAMVEIQKVKGLFEDTEHMVSVLETDMSLSYTRRLYDWYWSYHLANHGQDTPSPIIVDSDAMIHTPEIVYDLAQRLGLERSGVRLSWRPREEGEPADDMRKAFLRTLDTSGCIQKEKTQLPLDENGDIDGEPWKREFGERLGKVIGDCVRAAMGDYEYLQKEGIHMKSRFNHG